MFFHKSRFIIKFIKVVTVKIISHSNKSTKFILITIPHSSAAVGCAVATFDSMSLMMSFIAILIFQPIIGIVDGYSIYTREINKLKTDIKLGRLKKLTDHQP